MYVLLILKSNHNDCLNMKPTKIFLEENFSIDINYIELLHDNTKKQADFE